MIKLKNYNKELFKKNSVFLSIWDKNRYSYLGNMDMRMLYLKWYKFQQR